MNEALLTRNFWLEYIYLGLPVTILIIKIVLGYIFSLERIEKQSYTKFKLIRALEKNITVLIFMIFMIIMHFLI